MIAPIPAELLSETAEVRVMTEGGGYEAEPRRIEGVRFQGALSLGHGISVADGAEGILFIDAANSLGAFAIPEGSLVRLDGGRWRAAIKVEELHGLYGQLHHWEVHIG